MLPAERRKPKMKRNILAALLAAALAAGTAGCLEKKEPVVQNSGNTTSSASADGNAEGTTMTESMELMRLKYADVPEASSGPVIKISDTSAKPGEMAEVTVSVNGANENWMMCGIHITYPDVLKCKLENEDGTDFSVDYEAGPAIKKSAGFVAMDWELNLPEEMVRNKTRSLFFTTVFKENDGRDGDIATFYFKVPEDAKPGTVYDLGYYFMDSDMFRNAENDQSFEKYAFEHLQGGSITVK
jgi:hypothetical protein